MHLDAEEQPIALFFYERAWACGYAAFSCSLRQVAKRHGFCRLKMRTTIEQLEHLGCLKCVADRAGTWLQVYNPMQPLPKPEPAQDDNRNSNQKINHDIDQVSQANRESEREQEADAKPESDQQVIQQTNQVSEPVTNQSATDTSINKNNNTTSENRQKFNQVAVVYAGIISRLTGKVVRKPKFDATGANSAAVGLKRLLNHHEPETVIAMMRFLENHGGALREEVAAGHRMWTTRRWRKLGDMYRQRRQPRLQANGAKPSNANLQRQSKSQHKAIGSKLFSLQVMAEKKGALMRMQQGHRDVRLSDDEITQAGGDVDGFRHACQSVPVLKNRIKDLPELHEKFGWAYANYMESR